MMAIPWRGYSPHYSPTSARHTDVQQGHRICCGQWNGSKIKLGKRKVSVYHSPWIRKRSPGRRKEDEREISKGGHRENREGNGHDLKGTGSGSEDGLSSSLSTPRISHSEGPKRSQPGVLHSHLGSPVHLLDSRATLHFLSASIGWRLSLAPINTMTICQRWGWSWSEPCVFASAQSDLPCVENPLPYPPWQQVHCSKLS